MAGFQVLAPLLLGILSPTVGEDLSRRVELAVGGGGEIDAIGFGPVGDLQTDAAGGAALERGNHVVRPHTSPQGAVGGGQHHSVFELLHLGLVVFVFEERGARGEFIDAGHQADELQGLFGRGGFGGGGEALAGELAQGVAHVVHVGKICGQGGLDHPVVLASHRFALHLHLRLRVGSRGQGVVLALD